MIARVTADLQNLEIEYESEIELLQTKVSFTKFIRNHRFKAKGRWKGDVKFYSSGGRLIKIGLWVKLKEMCNRFHFPLTFVGLKAAIFVNNINPDEVRTFCYELMKDNPEIKMIRDRQIDAVYKLVRFRYCMGNLATSAGKSLIIFMYFMYLRHKKMCDKILIITKDADAVMQLHAEFVMYANAKFKLKAVMVHGGSSIKDVGDARIIIGNFQTLSNRDMKFFNNITAVIVDECVSADTMVDTIHGKKLIGEIQIGDKVLSADDYGNIVYDEVVNKWDKGKKLTYTITTDNGYSVDCTENHKLITNKGELYVREIIELYKIDIIVCYTVAMANNGWEKTKCIEAVIISVKEKIEETVYDIETKTTHKFFANNILVHNCQTGANDSIKYILNMCPNTFCRVGVSGSLKEDDSADIYELYSGFGPVVCTVKKKEIMDAGEATPIDIRVFILNWATKEQRKLLCKLKMAGEMDDIEMFHMEQEMVRNSAARTEWITKFVGNTKGNTLVLFIDVKGQYGKKLLSKFKDAHKDKDIYYIDGDVHTDMRAAIKSRMEEGTNKILLATYATYGTSKSIKNLHYVVCAESMKGHNIISQGQGRGMRLHDSKNVFYWIDITDDISILEDEYRHRNYSLKQLDERVKLYKNEGFDFEIKKIDLTSPEPDITTRSLW